MATTVSYNGSNFSIPANREPRGWGSSLTNFLLEVAQASMTPAGGNYGLQADLNLGADGSTFGLVALYYKSVTANIAQSGQLRLARTDTIAWRNQANGADLALGVSASDRLQFDSVNIPTISSTDTLTNKTLTSPVITSPTGLVKADVGLGNVDNTSDANKPISSATQAALDLKAPINNPTFTGTVAGVTAAMVGLGNVDNTSDATKNSATVTLTNKTLDNPIIDNSLTMLHESTPSTPDPGRVRVYPKSDNSLYILDENGVETQVGSGSGQGEKNYITNPSAKSAITGWNNVGDLDVARTTTAAELPREHTTGAGIKITADGNSQGTDDYVYFDFTLDDVDLGNKLKIQWAQKPTGSYDAGNLAVIITSQADRTTALVTPQTTAIPDADTNFVTTFDAPSSPATLSLVIRATTDMATDAGIVISDVVVGPGQVVQGAAISEWQSYTPTFTGFGSATIDLAQYRRVGSNLEGLIRFVSGTPTATQARVSLPSGLTISVASGIQIGDAVRSNTSATTRKRYKLLANNALNYVLFTSDDYTTASGAYSALNADAIVVAAEAVSMQFTVPIAEWAGSGTVNLGPGAQVEYAATSGTWDGTGTTTVYGPQGSLMGGALTAARLKTVTWQYPIQQDDLILLEMSYDGTRWFQASTNYPRVNDSTGNDDLSAGAWIQNQTASTTVIQFNRYANIANDDSPAVAWPSNVYWRVRKAKASSPVGFGKANSTEFGLVAPRRGQQSLTVTSNVAGWATARAVGIYYQDQDGNHRLKFNLYGTNNSGARTGCTLTISGVTFKNTTNFFQACSFITDSAATPLQAYTNPNASTIGIVHTSATTAYYGVSGDVELESRPSWA